MTETLKVVSFVNGLRNDIQKVMLMQQPCATLVMAIANAKLIENGLKITDNKKQVNFMEQQANGQNLGHDILAVLTDKMNRMEMELRKGFDQTPNYKADKSCHYCRRKGHFESECFKKEKDVRARQMRYNYPSSDRRQNFGRPYEDRRDSYRDNYRGRDNFRDRGYDYGRNRGYNNDRDRGRDRERDQGYYGRYND